MLIEFRVENHRSLREEQALTLEAGRVGAEDDPRPRAVTGHDARLLTVAALYGANASGKSNVLSALGWMREAVTRSHRAWAPEGGVPREPFAWGGRVEDPSVFEVVFIQDGIRTQYGFVADNERFLEEWLYAWPHGRKQVWFEREGDEFHFGEHLRGENRLIQAVTRPNALFLSAAVQLRHTQLGAVYGWFSRMNVVNVGEHRPDVPGQTPRYWFLGMKPEDRERALWEWLVPGGKGSKAPSEALRDFLRGADVGIVDLKVEDVSQGISEPRRRVRILLRHQSTDPDAWLPLDQESNGTRSLLRMAPAILDALWHGGVLLVDELESNLHPSLALHIVRLFNDPATNPRNAQILFATHDTNLLGNLLGEPPLRRDQVWLTEKDAEGGTRLYALTDFKPRKAENLERGYLQGRYGAIPFLGDLALLKD